MVHSGKAGKGPGMALSNSYNSSSDGNSFRYSRSTIPSNWQLTGAGSGYSAKIANIARFLG
jgi:hypothetical protein